MRSTISVFLTIVFLCSGLAAQSARVPESATKPIQPSDSAAAPSAPAQPPPCELKLPAGTSLDIEATYTVRGRVVEAKRGGHWGKAGRLSWTIQDVVAIDGTRVPLQAQKDLPAGRNGIKGTSHGGEVAMKTVLMGVLLAPVFPIAPLALMSGFKRGEDAVLPQGKRFVVYVQTDTVVKGSVH